MKLLVVDDDHGVRDALQVVLSEAGHEVVAVGSGMEMVKALGTFRPDLVLLDLMLPSISGEEVAVILRRRAIKFIFVTARMFRHGEAAQFCLRHGAHSVLLKPFDSEHLFQRIESATRPQSGVTPLRS